MSSESILEIYLRDTNKWVRAKLEPADEHDMEEMETAVDEKAVRIPQDLNRTPKVKRQDEYDYDRYVYGEDDAFWWTRDNGYPLESAQK